MPRYRILAARDGDMIEEIAEWPSESVAEAWAAGTLAHGFGLDTAQFDTLDKIEPEIDGCRFEEMTTDAVAAAAIKLLKAVSSIISDQRFTPLMSRTPRQLALLESGALLASALIAEGYGNTRE